MKYFFALTLATASLVFGGAALAQDVGPASIGEAMGQLFEDTGLRSTPPPPADFVLRSRTGDPDYAPLATPEKGKKAKTRSASELEQLQKELDRAGAANRGRAARVKIPDGAAPRHASETARKGAAGRD